MTSTTTSKTGSTYRAPKTEEARQHMREYQRQYRAKHRDKVREWNLRYYTKVLERARAAEAARITEEVGTNGD